MAGSLRHIVDDNDGGFLGVALLDDLGDAYEALEECYDIIAVLVNGDLEKLRAACDAAGYGCPDIAPILGARSVATE